MHQTGGSGGAGYRRAERLARAGDAPRAGSGNRGVQPGLHDTLARPQRYVHRRAGQPSVRQSRGHPDARRSSEPPARGVRTRAAADKRRARGIDQGLRDTGLHRDRERLPGSGHRPSAANTGGEHRRPHADARRLARAGNQRGLECLGGLQSRGRAPRPEYRLAQELGRCRREPAGGASGADGSQGRDGLSVRADRAALRVLRRALPGPTVQIPAAL